MLLFMLMQSVGEENGGGRGGELGRLRWALVGYIARQLLGFGCVPAACPPPVVERL